MRQLASFRQSLHLEYRACVLSIVQQVAHLTFLSASSCRLQETTRRHGPCDWCLFGLLHPFSLVSHTLSRTLVSHTCLAHLSRTLVSHIRAPKHRGPERVGLGSWRMRLRPQGVTYPRSCLSCACLVSGVHRHVRGAYSWAATRLL